MFQSIVIFFVWFWSKLHFKVSPHAEPPGVDVDIRFERLNPEEKVMNGQRARALLEDPLLNACFESVGNKYRMAWENSPRGDLETQRVAHMAVSSLKDVQGAIRAHLSSAQLYEAAIEEKTRRERSLA